MNQIINVGDVRGYINEKGVAMLNTEDVARGFGFTRIKNGAEYVMWDRVNKYLTEFGFPHECGKEDFIPENMVYRLGFKAKNETAISFQAFLADEVLPAIRKYGVFAVESMLENPDALINALIAYKEEKAKTEELKKLAAVQNQQIAELQPKASYYDLVLQCKDVVSTSVIAKDYGWSARQMNKWLHEQGIQFKQGGIWLLYQDYAEKGYTRTKTFNLPDGEGELHNHVHTYWTQKGRLFIYNLMTSSGYYPIIEK